LPMLCLTQANRPARDSPSFPTRRSSDLLRVTEKTGVNFELQDLGKERVHIKAVGVGGHASTPETAINAITGLLTLISKLPLSEEDRKSTRLNSSHVKISYAVFCLKKNRK